MVIMRRCFTLIELLVVIAIIAILAGMLLPALNSARDRVQGTDCLSQVKQLTFGTLCYADSNDDFPPDVQSWWAGTNGIGTYINSYVTITSDSGRPGKNEEMYVCKKDLIPLDNRSNSWGGPYIKRHAGKWRVISYGVNGQIFPCRSNAIKGTKVTKLKYPSNAACLGDSNFPVIGYPGYYTSWNVFVDYPVRWAVLARHADRSSASLSFFDGSARLMKLSDIPNLSNSEGVVNNKDTTDITAKKFWFGNDKSNY